MLTSLGDDKSCVLFHFCVKLCHKILTMYDTWTLINKLQLLKFNFNIIKTSSVVANQHSSNKF